MHVSHFISLSQVPISVGSVCFGLTFVTAIKKREQPNAYNIECGLFYAAGDIKETAV